MESIQRHSGIVDTFGHLLFIGQLDEVPEPDPDYPYLNFLSLYTGRIRIEVGTRFGPVNASVEVLAQAPPLEPDAWEDIDEGDIAYSGSGLILQDEVGLSLLPAEPETTFTPDGEHRYRVRVSARGRNIDYDHCTDVPLEDYLIQLWPVTCASPRVSYQNRSGR
ncbi:hypothetical protein IEU95_00380 [Hoyosella rhizosphaerae]|uniref:Uncharacterized protein n=1 Tax=Hoyosella rhizosphaerae TaxID=1755582 RepID=A0A916UK89_9ACTN|nr:hypothetical protein [Hoyosella rhizosphaerae]MBN4925276.1 hypothetical protein [Hoyosella rhizosphaerae]GGC76578.1 hypothetical protein GCM10011410_32310 [Hoyosella rhizosphaerae]